MSMVETQKATALSLFITIINIIITGTIIFPSSKFV